MKIIEPQAYARLSLKIGLSCLLSWILVFIVMFFGDSFLFSGVSRFDSTYELFIFVLYFFTVLAPTALILYGLYLLPKHTEKNIVLRGIALNSFFLLLAVGFVAWSIRNILFNF